MSDLLEAHLSPAITKTTLYHVVRLGLRLYVACLVIAGVYSVFWVAELAGVIPDRLLSTVWIAIAVMGCLFLALLIPLFYASGSR